ncbi:MAG: hypothetical protein AAF741_09145 [Bacteroidota bacterium]
MKTLLSSIIIFSFGFAALSAQNNYETAMQQSFEALEQGQVKPAQQMFERIAIMETDKWVPLYHSVNLLIGESFETEDKEKRELLLGKAKELIAEAHDRSPNNAELLTLEGLLYTSYVTSDPQTYGMIYSSKIAALHQRAMQADSENPRAMLNALEWNMGSARFFGNDIKPICEKVEAVIPMFDSYESDVAFAPTHGLEKAERILADCNND